jgi:hypothetical protein
LPRESTATAPFKLRIHNDLRHKLEVEAQRHRTSLNNEIRLRLEDSLIGPAHMDIWQIAQDIKANWLRLQATRELLALGDQMAEALETGAAAKAVEATTDAATDATNDASQAERAGQIRTVIMLWRAARATAKRAEERRFLG